MQYIECPRSLPQHGGPGPRIYIPQEQGGPVIPPDIGFLFVVSYVSQDYGGGIRTRLHSGLTTSTQLILLVTFRQEPHRKHLFHCYSPTIS
jgi:hypothetical protein